MILILLAVAAVILAVVFWKSIAIYLMPKAALTTALSNTVSQLDERFRYNPIRNMLGVYDREGRYTAQAELKTSNDLLGEITYDMTVQTDMSGHQLMAEGTAAFSGQDLALALYMNGDYMAVSSDELLNGNYYGITYNTFASDLESFPLVKYLIPGTTVQKWEESLKSLQNLMNRSYEAPEITESDVRMLFAGILLLDSKVDREEVLLNGQTYACHKITYSAGGKEVKEVLSHILDTSGADSAEITACFYVHQNIVVKLEIAGAAGENRVSYVLTLGENALTDVLTLTEERFEKGETCHVTLTVDTQLSGYHYMENLDMVRTANGIKQSDSITYDWDSGSGDMIFGWNNGMPIRLNLTQNEEGIRLISEDFAQLTALLLQSEKETSAEISGIVTLSKGSSVEAPIYKNMDTWSMEDLITLLTGIGSLIGFQI